MSRLEQLLQMLQQEPHDPFLNYAVALEHGKSGNISKAISIIEEILQRDENYLGAYYQLAKYYEEAGEKEKAVSAYRKGMEVAKRQNNRKALGELGTALMMLEDED